MTLSGKKGRLEQLLVVAAVLEFLALTAIHLCAIPVHISRLYNEGWNAYFAQAAMGHGVLYPAADSMLTNNYPPLSFYIVGLAGRLTGDDIVAGRWIALLALGVVTFNVYRLGRWLGAERQLSLLGAGVFLLGTYTIMPGYIAANDPQFLAHALVMSGSLVFLTTAQPHWWRGMLLSSLLMVLGGLVKHSDISLPLTLCTWSAFYDRKRLGVFLLCALMVGGVACAVAYGVWGRPMVDAVFFGMKLFQPGRGWARMLPDIPFLLPYLILATLALIWTRRRPQAAFVLLYAVWSLVSGFWMMSCFGVNQNVMSDAVIALSLGAVLFVLAIEDSSTTASIFSGHGRALATLLIFFPCALASLVMYLSNPYLRDVGEIVNAGKWNQLYETLALAKGEVACETPAVCYWAKKPMDIDFFNYGQRVFSGKVYADAPGGFLDKVTHKSYAYVVIETGQLPRNRLPPVLIDALFENYQPVGGIAGAELLMAPRP
jgi:hypothetical protein